MKEQVRDKNWRWIYGNGVNNHTSGSWFGYAELIDGSSASAILRASNHGVSVRLLHNNDVTVNVVIQPTKDCVFEITEDAKIWCEVTLDQYRTGQLDKNVSVVIVN